MHVEKQLWALAQELRANGQNVIFEWSHWARVEQKRAASASTVTVSVGSDVPVAEVADAEEQR